MAAPSALHSIASPQRFPPPWLPSSSSTTSLPIRKRGLSRSFVSPHPWRSIHRISSQRLLPSTRDWAVGSLTDDLDVIPLRSGDPTYHDSAAVFGREREWADESPSSSSSAPVSTGPNASGFAYGGDAGGFPSSSHTSHSPLVDVDSGGSGDDLDKLVDRSINATIALTAGAFAITKLLTIDHDYWHGWTFFEILRYAPQHNWIAYEEALKTNPILAKMMISGIVYSLGDWIAQCYEGKPLFEFDRTRMFRSGLVGFTLHGSLSHYYYHFCEALFPVEDWWVVPAKVAFDQTIWSAIWNSIYFIILGFLRFESPVRIYNELKATFWPMLTTIESTHADLLSTVSFFSRHVLTGAPVLLMAGWKLWPFAHLITYGVIPLEQRLLWVDCVELLWVTILSTYSNEKSEARNSEFETDSTS